MGLGYVEGVTHDSYRHGTTTLFAALNTASGDVVNQCHPRHWHREFPAFLRLMDRSVPGELDVHLVNDTCVTHKHAKVRARLAARPRFHVYDTPTYTSWLNRVERWFGLITQRANRRGSLTRVPARVETIQRFVEHYNQDAHPLVWTATCEPILARLERLLKVTSGTPHRVAPGS